MNALRRQFAHRTSVAEVQYMRRRNSANGIRNQFDEPLVFRNAGDVRLRIVQRVDFGRYEFGEVCFRAKPLILRSLRFLIFDNQAHKNSAIITVDPLV